MRATPIVASPPRLPTGDARVTAALHVAERLCLRRTVGGPPIGRAHMQDVARELRGLFPDVAGDEFAAILVALEQVTSHISLTEAADPDDLDAYADAAWEARLDPADHCVVDDDDGGSVQHHRAVIQHWDLELRDAIMRLAQVAECHAHQ